MRVLFDQNVPVNLSRHLFQHAVVTARQLGWEELTNRELLDAAEDDGFELFVTCDQNLAYQQNLAARAIAIVELTETTGRSLCRTLRRSSWQWTHPGPGAICV